MQIPRYGVLTEFAFLCKFSFNPGVIRFNIQDMTPGTYSLPFPVLTTVQQKGAFWLLFSVFIFRIFIQIRESGDINREVTGRIMSIPGVN